MKTAYRTRQDSAEIQLDVDYHAFAKLQDDIMNLMDSENPPRTGRVEQLVDGLLLLPKYSGRRR